MHPSAKSWLRLASVSNPSSKYREWDIASGEINVNKQRTDGQTAYPKTQCLSKPIIGDGGIKIYLHPYSALVLT